MAIPLDKLVGQKMDAYRGNPQALQQRHQQNQQLLDLLALQKLKTEKDAVARDMQMKMKQNPGTIAEQLEAEHLNRTKKDMIEQAGGVMQQQQAKQQGNLQRAAQGAVPPPQAAAQGVAPPPNVANTGIAAAPRPPMRMAQGGVIGFQSRGAVDAYDEEGRLAANMDIYNVRKRAAQVDVPPDEILERMGLTRETWLNELTDEMRGKYLKEFPAISAETGQSKGDAVDRRSLLKKFVDWKGERTRRNEERNAVIQARDREAVARKKALPPAVPLVSPIGTTQGGIEEDHWGMLEQQAPPPSSPPAGATSPAAPVVKKDLLPTGGAGQVEPSGVSELLKATQAQADGAVPQQAAFPTAPAQADVLDRAEERADINPEDEYKVWGKRGLAALGRPYEVRQREQQRQASMANLLAQQQAPNKLRNERLSRLLQEGARTGTLGGASAGFSAAQREQEAAARKGLASIHKTERADEALDTTVREKVYAGAKSAYEKADEAIGKGIDVMAGIARDQQTNLTAEAKAMMESKDKRLDRILRAGLAEASMGMQADIANLVASTAKQRRDLDAAIEKLRQGRLSRNDAEMALVRSNEAMAKIKQKNAENFQKAEETLRHSPEFNAKGADKKKMIADLHRRRDTMLGVLLEGMPAQSRRLEERIKTLDRGPLKSVNEKK